ncbi:MAG: alpha/beta hydrolase [Acidimicrobiia bacterium]|nr:alpha/beta hydrolase [Acidimicrobiia bacterium]
MPRATVSTTNPSSLEIEYETFGSPDDPALLMVMGFAAQLIHWDVDLCRQLADRGRFVVRFDNRDCGLSTHLDGERVDAMAVLQAALAGGPLPPVPYTLSDMAADAVGLLDHLGLDRAHVMGASMGGMIAQTIAIEHADRVASLVSVMSSTGDLRSGQPTPEALAVLLAPPPTERAAYIDAAERVAVWSSKRYTDRALIRDRAAATYDRAFYPAGAPRQLAAIYASGDRRQRLGGLGVPTLVIHGRDDTLITPSGGIETAMAIPTADLLLLADMGHDLPRPLWPVIVDAVVAHTDRAAAAASVMHR